MRCKSHLEVGQLGTAFRKRCGQLLQNTVLTADDELLVANRDGDLGAMAGTQVIYLVAPQTLQRKQLNPHKSSVKIFRQE